MQYFDQKIYNENENVKRLEIELCDIGEEFNNLIKELIPDVENNDKVMKFLRKYEFKHNDILNLCQARLLTTLLGTIYFFAFL